MFCSNVNKSVLTALLCGFTLLCGCGKASSDTSSTQLPEALPSQISVMSGTPLYQQDGAQISCELEEGDELSISYSVHAEPLTYYQIKADNSGDCKVLLAAGENDINCRSITAEADEDGSMSRVIRSDSSGNLDFQLLVSGGGKSEVGHAEYIPAENVGYTIMSSSSGNVRILLHQDDISDSGVSSEQLVKWLDALDAIRKTASEWSADGLDSIDICAACEFEHYGLSGDPIYIRRKYMASELKKVAETIDLPTEQQDILWGFAHEICHAADGFGHGGVSPAVFDSELFAQLECACCLDLNGYRYNGKETPLEFFSDSPTLENRLYSDEGFIFRLLEIFDENGTGLKDILPVFTERRSQPQNQSASEGLEAFLDSISKCVGYDITAFFTETELITIRTKFAIQDRNTPTN